MPRKISESLRELAYSAALDDELWRDWSERMVDAFECRGALFWVMDLDNAHMCRSLFIYPNVGSEELSAEYLSGPFRIDPQVARVGASMKSEIWTDTEHVDPDDPATAEYLKWQIARANTRHWMTASAVIDESFKAGISLHRTAAAGPVTDEQRRALGALFPDIDRAIRLGFRHQRQLEESWWDGALQGGAAANPGRAAFLLDEAGRVFRLSEAAERMIAASDGLGVTHGRFTANDVDGLAHLDAAIRAATRDSRPRSGAVSLRRPSGRRAWQLLVYPLARGRRHLAPFQAAALVHLIDPAARAAPVSPHRRELFGLTDREAEVAGLLLADHSLESLAATLGISRNTARVHLRSIFHKTGTNRQAELVRLLLG